MGRHTTNLTGVIYRDSITNGKADKVYYIRYKDKNKDRSTGSVHKLCHTPKGGEGPKKKSLENPRFPL